MNREEIIKKVNEVFIDILDDNNIILNEESQASDIEGWDSLTHIQLIVGIERYFKIRFTSREIQSWNNVGELVESIEVKLKSN